MPQLRDFLSRFRPAGAPGAGRAAVPAPAPRGVAAELEPVLLLLQADQAECAGIVAAAGQEAERVLGAARADVAAMAARAARAADDIRRRAAAGVLASARIEAAAAESAAAGQAAEARELARQRIPVLAEKAVSLVQELGGDDARGMP